MTPKEKAEQLFDKYYAEKIVDLSTAKKCALICVDEILQSHYVALVGIKSSTYNFWQEVKKEIKLL